MRMAVRPRLVPRHQAVQGDRGCASGKRLLLNAFADLFPFHGAPVDLVNVHCGFLHFYFAEPIYFAVPSRPVGRKNRNSSNIDSAAMFLNAEPRTTMASAWTTPRNMPPASAPSGRPKPPTIAAIKPLMAKGTPRLKAVYWVGVISTPAKAPSAALRPNASASIRDTGMPCNAAASRSIEQARIALPVLVDEKNSASSAITSAEPPTIQRN